MSITTILNCYRRPQNLEAQVKAIRAQSTPSDEIWLWCNYHQDQDNFDATTLGLDKIIWSSHNHKFHGRFTMGLLAKTDYLAYFDDDTIPGHNWYTNCYNSISIAMANNIENPILGSAGVVLHSRQYENHTRVGWPSKNEQLCKADLVGHAWFFNRQVLNALWAYSPISLDNGEDIQLSFFAQKMYGTSTLVPPHPANDISLWGSVKGMELGVDNVAMSNGKVIPHSQFFKERDYVVGKCVDAGWKTIVGVK